MADGKNKIIVYQEWADSFNELTDQEAGKLIKHFFAYVNDEKPILKDRVLKMTWIPIQQTLRRDLKKWNQYLEKQSVNGRKGGRPKKYPLVDLHGNKIPLKSKHGHFIYLIYNKETKLYKIGETQNLIQRRYDIKEPTSNLIIFCFGMTDIIKCQEIEKEILNKFDKFRIKKGDWLNINDSHAYSILKHINQKTQAYNKIAKKGDSVIVNDSVIVSVNDNVILKEIEKERLIKKYGLNGYNWIINKLSFYKLSHGKKYKSDYGAINSWVVKEWKKENNNGLDKKIDPRIQEKMRKL